MRSVFSTPFTPAKCSPSSVKRTDDYRRTGANLSRSGFVPESIGDRRTCRRDGKVISVRLALFSDMMKSRSWTPASLTEVGGNTGVGVTFLEETFSSRTAPPQASPTSGGRSSRPARPVANDRTDIKGHNRSASEFASSLWLHQTSPGFSELIRILDSEVRLITQWEVIKEEERIEKGEVGSLNFGKAIRRTL